MIPYFVLFGIWLVGAIQFSSKTNPTYERIMYTAALVLTTLMVGLRYEVGGDWFTYREIYNNIALQSLGGAFKLSEPAYVLLNWLSAKVDLGVYIPNLGCAVVFMLGLSTLVRKQPQPWLAMTVAVPYLVIVVGMGYTRQAAAIGAICWAISGVERDKIWQTIAKIAFAALFHKTAILFLPILLAPVARRNLLMAIIGSALFAILAFVALRGQSDALVTNYVNSNYQSSGAAIRIGMNVLAALAFFLFRKKLPLPTSTYTVWTISAYLSIASVFGLLFSSSSVGVDRISLFLIPLQVFVYSNICSIKSFTRGTRTAITLLVMAYSFSVEYVYFFHGTFSYTWLPYQNVIWADESSNFD